MKLFWCIPLKDRNVFRFLNALKLSKNKVKYVNIYTLNMTSWRRFSDDLHRFAATFVVVLMLNFSPRPKHHDFFQKNKNKRLIYARPRSPASSSPCTRPRSHSAKKNIGRRCGLRKLLSRAQEALCRLWTNTHMHAHARIHAPPPPSKKKAKQLYHETSSSSTKKWIHHWIQLKLPTNSLTCFLISHTHAQNQTHSSLPHTRAVKMWKLTTNQNKLLKITKLKA